ncbi:MAG: MBL fold metallo-hydrolase [Chitinivibrionales bacterium]|nr:MBL fold metallo-hydrolase [Chitinivibrionales bacterium]MBD3394597.1 MBL fold metallo-hydrolase [Chitinivibrionales bacterium]
MYIRCWGSRGSIPVSGKDYLKYGGDTTCMELRSRSGALIVVDAGTGIRPLGHRIAQGKVKKFDLLFTHAHWDHMIGFPFFAPIYMRGFNITVRGFPFDSQSFRDILDGFMRSPYFPVSLTDKHIKAKLAYKKIADRAFTLGGITIRPVPLSHPKNGGRGFRFEENGRSFVFLTDNELDYVHEGGLAFDEYVEFCRDADLLIHDAEYDRREYRTHRAWGHTAFTDAVKLGLAAGVRRLGLFHLNNRRTDDQMDAIVEQSREIIAHAKSRMECFAVGSMYELTL